jgi:hypothetical protein
MKKTVFTSFLLLASNEVILMQATMGIVAFGKKIASQEILYKIPRNDQVSILQKPF